MRTSYGVQIRRPDYLARILLRLASKRGKGKPYVVADLLRDCLLSYTNTHAAFQPVGFDDGKVTTVYVRGNAKEKKYFRDLAHSQSFTLGRLLEAAILFHCGDDIVKMREKESRRASLNV